VVELVGMSLEVTRLELLDTSWNPRSTFSPGEKVWAKIYLLTVNPSGPSVTLRLTLNGSIIKEVKVGPSASPVEGYVAYDFTAPTTAGTYQVCATIVETGSRQCATLVVTPPAKIAQLTVTYTEQGVEKTINLTNGTSINADVNTDVTIKITYQNTGTATLRTLPWIVLYKEYKDPSTIWLQGYPIECGGTTLAPAPPNGSPISVSPGATVTNTFPTFKMPNNKLLAELRIYAA